MGKSKSDKEIPYNPTDLDSSKCLTTSMTSIHTYLKSHPHKRQKIKPVTLIPITFVELKVKQENKTYAAGSTLIIEKAVQHLKMTTCKKTSFNCMAGNFSSSGKCNVHFKMAEFNPTATISHRDHVTDTLGQYVMIIGRELMHTLGIDLHFSTASMHWRDVEVSMKGSTCAKEETFHIKEELFVSEETNQISKILDTKYAPADLQKIVEGLPQLDKEQQDKLLALL